jgi:hypothetical protein
VALVCPNCKKTLTPGDFYRNCSRPKGVSAGAVRLRPAARRGLSQLSRLRNEPDAILAGNAVLRQRVTALANLVGLLSAASRGRRRSRSWRRPDVSPLSVRGKFPLPRWGLLWTPLQSWGTRYTVLGGP